MLVTLRLCPRYVNSGVLTGAVGVFTRTGTVAAGCAKGEQPDTSRTRQKQTRKQQEAVEPMPRIWFLPKGHRPTKSPILFARSSDVNPTTILNTYFLGGQVLLLMPDIGGSCLSSLCCFSLPKQAGSLNLPLSSLTTKNCYNTREQKKRRADEPPILSYSHCSL
jgi:hypothetical protein